MRYINLVRNSQVPFLYNFQFRQIVKTHTFDIGTCSTTLIQDRAVINLLEINYPYKYRGHGKFYLKETEDYLHKHFGITHVSLTAWQPTPGFDVLNFFMKNGYKHQLPQITETHDDGATIYDLHSLFKTL